jgi:hypothetical protein
VPDGFIGELLKVVGRHVPPPPGVLSPSLWGTEGHLRELFGDRVQSLACSTETFTFRFASADAFVDYFRAYYGPTLKAFETVGPDGADALHADVVELVERYARPVGAAIAIPATYLQTVAVRSA